MIDKITCFLMIFSLIACHSDSIDEHIDETKTEAAIDELEGYTTIALPLIDGEGDIKIPGKKLTKATPELFKNNAGVTNLKVGENFHLEITEQTTDLDKLVNDLNQDIFYKSKILSKTEDEIVYEKNLPDGSKSFFHFCKTFSNDGHEITIRSANTGQFKQSHMERMMKSANSFSFKSNNHLLSATPN